MQEQHPLTAGFLGSTQKSLDQRDGLSTGWQAVIFLLALVALFSRCPSMFTHAQFYAEDGTIWFAQAYNGGWLHTLLVPQAGYLNIVPRLGAGLALLFPLSWAPLVMALVGMMIQAAPLPLLLSSQCRGWGSLSTRLGLAAIYLAIPNRELHVVLTNSQWHLAVFSALAIFSAVPQTWWARVVESTLLLLAALSGPFGLVLAPMAFLFWWLRRERWTLVVCGLLGLGSGVQMAVLLHGAARVQGPLGATVALFLRMLGGDIVAGALVGQSSIAWRAPMGVIVALALLGLAIYGYCLWHASLEWKFFLAFCGLLLAASLRSPLTSGSKPAWDSLLFAVAARYWFLPMLAFTWGALWCARYGRARLFRWAGAGIVLCMVLGVVRDWNYGRIPGEDFSVGVARMSAAQPGEHVVMPIVPAGWSMELVKKR